MNREEKAKHDNEISNRFITRSDYNESDLEGLSIQDLCVLVNSANYALVNKIFEGAEENMPRLIQRFLNVLLQKIRNADILYTVIDNNTGFPFIDEHADDCVWIFSTKEYAEEAVEYYSKSYRNFKVGILENKNLNNFAEDLYLNGIFGIYIDNGYTSCVIKKEDLFPTDVFDKKDGKDKPVINPGFMLAHLEMVQEASWQVNYDGRESIVKSLEKEVINQLLKAHFLVPVKGLPEKTKDEDKVILEKDTQITIPGLEGKDGRNGIPVFTDWKQFKFIYSDEEFKGLIMTYEELSALVKEQGKAVVINVGSCLLELNGESIKTIESFINEK